MSEAAQDFTQFESMVYVKKEDQARLRELIKQSQNKSVNEE